MKRNRGIVEAMAIVAAMGAGYFPGLTQKEPEPKQDPTEAKELIEKAEAKRRRRAERNARLQGKVSP